MSTTKYEEFIKPYKEGASAEAKLVYEAAAGAFRAEIAERDAIGATLATARKRRRLSQQAVADGAGIQQAELSRIENGLGNPTVDTLLKILAALDLRMTIESPHLQADDQRQ